MKKNYKQCKTRFLLFFLLSLFAGGLSPAWADELTIADGTTTNSYTPFDAGNADYGIKGEYIIPAADLAAMNGMSITSIKLYANTNNTTSKPNYGPFQVFMKEVENPTPYSSSSSAFQGMDDATIVYEGTVVVASKEMLITFDTPYDYKGGNLLIGFYKDKGGNYYSNKFYGVNQDGYTGCSSYSSSGISSITYGTGRSFIPKTTFTYEATSAYKKPATLTYASVTSSSAVINWTAGSGDDSETGWNLEYKTSDSDTWTEVHGLPASPLTYSLTSLAANTSYDVRVSAVYAGGESKWVSTTFKTEKVSTPATGFTDNFETDKGWELINGTQTNKWVRGSATNNGGSNALYISNDGGTTNAYSHSASITFATKLFAFEAGDYTIAYDWKASGESQYDFLRVALVPASEELTAGTTPSNFAYNGLPSGWQALDGGSKLNLQSDWQSKSVDITIESAGRYQVVFVWKNDGSGGTQTPAAAIDNFKIVGSAPVLELGGDVAGTALAFGSVAETTNKTIRITNSGKVAMENITLTETADADNVFAYTALPKTTLDANESMDVTITFSGSSAQEYTGTFRVSADDCDPIDVTVTATFSNSPATMALTLDEVAVGASVAFGEVGKQMVKTFTVTNDGDQTLNVAIASNNTTDFTVAPAALNVTGHTSETFTVTFVYDAEALDAEKTATITVTPSNGGLDPVAFTVTGTRIEQWSEDFSGNALPDGWENENSSYWTFSNGVAIGSYAYNSNYGLITPLLIVEEGETLSFEARATSTYENLVITMSKNGGAWETCKTISYSSLPTTMTTFTIDGLAAGNYKFRFKNGSFELDNFQGFKRNMNDPKMGIYSDAECTAAVATSVTNDFGFVTTDQIVSYYIKNDGTGTMTLSKGDDPAGFTASLDKTSVAAGEHATLTITMPVADNGGYHSGNVVVTATDLGAFTVAAQGVVVEDGKLNLNFATDNIPSTWTANDWMKDANGYIKTGESGYSNTSMETSTLTATAGEQLVVVAKNGYTSSSYTFGVKYKQVGAEEWSDLIPATNIGTSWKTLTGTIAEAGDYLLQFNGYYASIQRIYGLSEVAAPAMTLDKDGDYNFGLQTAAAEYVITVTNDGNANLTDLAAVLTNGEESDYTVSVSETTVAPGETATITITQKFDLDDLGSHSDVLTISSNAGSKTINLSGSTRDGSKLYVDFSNNAFPEGWTVGANWAVTSGYAYQSSAKTPSALVTTPLTVAENETLTYKVARYQSGSGRTTSLKIRYSQDGGITWSDYVECYNSDDPNYGSSLTPKELDLPSGNIIIEFYGSNIKLDDIQGVGVTSAPALALTEDGLAISNGDTKAFGNLTADGVATYTLKNIGNADMVSTVTTTGEATVAISGEDEGITITENIVTLAAGKSATVTLTVPYTTSYGDKNGAMTIATEGWVGDMVVNYTATTIDETAIAYNFDDNKKPAGWYVSNNGNGFSFGSSNAKNAGSEQVLITEQMQVSGTEDILTYDASASAYYNVSIASLEVSYSTDRKNWTLVAEQPTLGVDLTTFQVKGLEAGSYYLRFKGAYVTIDNIYGWHKVIPAPDHDLYVSDATFPTTTLIPETEDGVSASVTVNSLRADESGVYAKLFFDETEIATAEAQDIAKDGNKTFNLIGNVPATEKTYAAKIVVYYSDETVAWETATTEVEVAHTKTLDIKEFTRTDEGGDLTADENNQFSAAFSVKVQNTGTTEATPTVKIFIGETEVGSATATETVAVEGETTIAVNVTNASAGEGGELEFTAKAYWTAEGEALATSANNVTINVAAAAPKFALYEGEIAVENNTAVNFGLQTAAKTISYTIKNEGNKAMELVSIVAPEGFEATALTEGNKTIAVDGALNIDVTLKAEQGKVAGDLVITYKVDAMTDNTFTLALSGRSIAADTWTEDFESGSIPADWTNENGWSIGITDGNRYATRTGWEPYSIMTPRLQAAKDEVLTFDVLSVGNSFSYAYSTDKENWSDEVVIEITGEQTFTAPAAGNYYLRFTTRNGRLDNLIGFRLDPLNLILDETASNDFITANYDNVTLNRAFIAGWNTVCLPFAIDNITAFFGDGAYAYTYTGYNEGDLTFTIVEDAMTAATPYLVFVPAAITSKELKNIAISGEDAGSVGDENATFTGTYDRIAADGELAGKYVLTPNATIQKAGDGAWMNAFRAYFTIPTGLVKALVFDGGTATGVRRIELTGNEDVRDIFDLAGRKLNETRKGINIVNGKKVLVK